MQIVNYNFKASFTTQTLHHHIWPVNSTPHCIIIQYSNAFSKYLVEQRTRAMLVSNSQTQCPLHATSLTCLSTGSSHLGPRLYVVFVERRHGCNTLSIWRFQVLNHCWSSWAAFIRLHILWTFASLRMCFSQACMVHWCDLNWGIISLKRRLKQRYKHGCVPAPFFSTDLLNSHLVSHLELTAVYHQSCPQQK